MRCRGWLILTAAVLCAAFAVIFVASAPARMRFRREYAVLLDEVVERKVFGGCAVVFLRKGNESSLSDYDGNIVYSPVQSSPSGGASHAGGGLTGVWAGESVLIAQGEDTDGASGYWLVTTDGKKARWFADGEQLLRVAKGYGVETMPRFQTPRDFVIDR